VLARAGVNHPAAEGGGLLFFFLRLAGAMT